MRNSLICIFLSVFGLMACTEADDLTFREGDGVVVNFTTPGLISGEVGVTRADPPVNLAKDVTVRILAYRRTGATANISSDTYIGENTYVADADGKLTACVVDANGKKITGTPTELRLIQGDYDFYAITPAVETKDNLHEEVEIGHGVDYATSLTTQSIAPGSGTVNLNTLDRKCSMVDFAIAPKYNNVSSLSIKSATLESMAKSPLQGNLAQDLSAAATNDESVTVEQGLFKDDPEAPTDKIKILGSKVLLPKTKANFKLGMEVFFNGSSTSTVLTPATIKDLAFTKGNRYTFSIALKGGNVTLNLTVSGWTDVNWNVDDLGATNSITVTVGTWTDVNFDTSIGGGNVDITTGTWQPDVNWDITLETNPGLTAEGAFTWEDANVDSSTGGGNISGNGNGWNGNSSVDSSTGGGNVNGGGSSWGNGGANDATTGNGNSTTTGNGAQWGGDTSIDSSTGDGNVNGTGPGWTESNNTTDFDGDK